MPFAATWMELETLIQNEVSQKEKDKYHVITHIWNLIYNTMNLSTEKKLMDLENRLVVAEGEGVGWTGEPGVNRCKLLLLEWISNEILLCITENCV